MNHKVEINSLECKIAAKVKTKDGKKEKSEKRAMFINSVIMDNFISHLSSVGSIDINIPEGRYQLVRIELANKATHKREPCYKFKLSYLHREKDLYSKADKANLSKRSKMDYRATEFPQKFLYFVYFPKTQEIASDSRCLNNVLTRVFIEVINFGYKDYADHGLAKGEVKSALRLAIRNVVKDNFNEVLNSGGILKELTFSLKKPSESKKKALVQSKSEKIYQEVNKAAYKILPEIIGKIFGVNVNKKVFDSLPTSRVRITIAPDEEHSKLSQVDKDALREITENDFLSTSSIKYTESNDDEIKRSFIRGVAYSYDNSLKWNKLDDDNSMFKELLKHYNSYRQS